MTGDNENDELEQWKVRLAQARGETAEARMLLELARNRNDVAQTSGDILKAYEQVTDAMIKAIEAYQGNIPAPLTQSLQVLPDDEFGRIMVHAKTVEQLRDEWKDRLVRLTPVMDALQENSSPLSPAARVALEKKFNEFKLTLERKLELHAGGTLGHD